MIAALMILIVAAADSAIGLFELAKTSSNRRPEKLGHAPRRDPAAIALGVGTAAAVAAAGWLAVGVSLPVAIAMMLLAVVWVVAGQAFTVSGKTAPVLVTAVIIVAATAAGAVMSAAITPRGPAVLAFSQWTQSVGLSVTPAVVVGMLAVALALTRTSNLICRAALGRTIVADAARPPSPVRRRWAFMIGTRRVASLVEAAPLAAGPSGSNDADATPAGLKGGRVIGPLERILIVALGVVGSQALIVGLLAAKGIVRFPEISADNRNGAKAEEFLVGSLVSWTLAGLGVALLAWLQNS